MTIEGLKQSLRSKCLFTPVSPIKMFDICKPKYRYSRLLYELMRTTELCVLSILARRFQTVILMLIIEDRLRWIINSNISVQLSESLQHAVKDY